MSSTGAVVLAIGYLMPLGYFAYSLINGKRAPDNPWEATGLEWTTASPPPKHNFLTPPVVETEPYAYHDWDEAPGEADETMQTERS
jgi:cytochrome c oxidase subunit 1